MLTLLAKILRPVCILSLLALAGCSTLGGSTPATDQQAVGDSTLDQLPDDEAREALKLAHVLRDNGRFRAAYEVYKRLDDRQALSGSYLLEYASLAAVVKPPQQALTLYARAQRQLEQQQKLQDPNRQLAVCLGMGRAQLSLGRIDKAMETLECALSVDSSNVQALNALGVAQSLQGDSQAARQSFHAALEQDPGHTGALNNLALSWLSEGENGRAISLLRQSAMPGEISLQLNLALAYVMDGQDEQARRVLSEQIGGEFADSILNRFQSARTRVRAGAPVAQELLAASRQPLALREVE